MCSGHSPLLVKVNEVAVSQQSGGREMAGVGAKVWRDRAAGGYVTRGQGLGKVGNTLQAGR